MKKTPQDFNYIFFFPSHAVGGIPILFLRMAAAIKQDLNCKTLVIDFQDGYMALNRGKFGDIELIEYGVDNSITIPPNSILILQSDLPWGLPRNLNVLEDTKVFFWTCYPFNFVPVLPGKLKIWMSETPLRAKILLNTLLLPSKLKTRNFVKLLLKNSAVCFMDKANVNSVEYYLDQKVPEPIYIPVIVPSPLNPPKLPKHNGLTMCWIGRLGDFKTFILERVLADLSETSLNKKEHIKFIIIGDSPGYDMNQLLKHQNDFFKIEHISYATPVEINEILTSRVSLLFAMGTSALEGAKLGVPTILLNFSYSQVSSEYRYKFLYESKWFNLGELITPENIHDGYTMDKVLVDLKNNYENISEKTLTYFSKNHDSRSWIPIICEKASASTLTYTQLMKSSLIEKPYFYKLWALIKKLR